jgi:hypothetical protein
MGQLFTNAARSQLVNAITAASTTITITPGDVGLFPALTASNWCYLTIQDTSGIEIVKTTSMTSNSIGVQRGQQGTTARAFAAGSTVGLRITAADATQWAAAPTLNLPQTFTAAQRGAVVNLTDAATIAVDFAASNNFAVTLNVAGVTRQLANPTNIAAGQSGVIAITQDATGSRLLSFGSYWKFPGGAAQSLTTTANALDILSYYVLSTTQIYATITNNVQ